MCAIGATMAWVLGLTAVAASPEEIRQAHRWAAVAFARPRVATVPDDALAVVRRSHYVVANRSDWGTPLTCETSPHRFLPIARRSSGPRGTILIQ